MQRLNRNNDLTSKINGFNQPLAEKVLEEYLRDHRDRYLLEAIQYRLEARALRVTLIYKRLIWEQA